LFTSASDSARCFSSFMRCHSAIFCCFFNFFCTARHKVTVNSAAPLVDGRYAIQTTPHLGLLEFCLQRSLRSSGLLLRHHPAATAGAQAGHAVGGEAVLRLLARSAAHSVGQRGRRGGLRAA
jgi:hypothetical protein